LEQKEIFQSSTGREQQELSSFIDILSPVNLFTKLSPEPSYGRRRPLYGRTDNMNPTRVQRRNLHLSPLGLGGEDVKAKEDHFMVEPTDISQPFLL
jgi:hypothetical protein